jgi:hypothetical protein
VGPLLNADLVPMIDMIAQVAFAPDDNQLLARTLHGAWVVWPIPADTRAVAALQQDSALLNAPADEPLLRDKTLTLPSRDPGIWRAPDSRPQPPIARLVDGEPIPSRAQSTSPLLLDMTEAYTAAPGTVGNTIHALVPSLNLFPLGTVRIDGIDYDLRGAIQLTDAASGFGSAIKVAGLPVPATPIAAFRMLMLAGSFLPEPDGKGLVRLRIHYRDGSKADVPLRSGLELPGDPDDHNESVPLGWAWGDQMRLGGDERQPLLSNPRLPNPHPERLVASIDIETSAGVASSTTLFAITAEPFDQAQGRAVIAPSNSGIDTSATPVTTATRTQPRRNP